MKKENVKHTIGRWLMAFVGVLMISVCLSLGIAEADESENFNYRQWFVTPEDIVWGITLDEDEMEQYENSSVSSSANEVMVYSNLPSSVNLSTSNFFPPIRSQGSNGSCSAWASTYYQFTYEAAKLNNWNAKTDNTKVFSPKYVWNYLNEGENKGVFRAECYDLLEKQGSVTWATFPQNNTGLDWDQSTTSELMTALSVRLDGANSIYISFPTNMSNGPAITGYTDVDLQQIKNYLYQGHVLTFDTYACNWEIATLSNGEKGIVRAAQKHETRINAKTGEEETVLVGHAMTIVGYDDNVSFNYNGGTIEDSEKGAFLIANSWGTDQADHNNGYIWVTYDALNKVSNFSAYNSGYNGEVRDAFISGGACYKMAVVNHSPQLMVEVTLESADRNDITVELGTYNYSNGSESTYTTFLNEIGGDLDFDGLAAGTTNYGHKTRTFLFDYSNGGLYTNLNNDYYVKITDGDANDRKTKVLSIRWLDANGTVIHELLPQENLDGTYKKYWTDDYRDVFERAQRVTLHSSVSGVIETAYDVDYFKFVPTSTGTYLFYTTGALDTMGNLSDLTDVEIKSDDDGGITGNNFAFSHRLDAGSTYYIKVRAYGNRTGTYTLNITRDFYTATLNDTNQDARRVLMQAEAAAVLNTMNLTIGNNTYVITKPSSGTYDNTFGDGTRIKVTFETNNSGLSTIWIIQAKMQPTTLGTTDSVTFAFSGGKITATSPALTGLVAYASSVKTGVSDREANSLQLLMNSMSQTGYSLTAYHWDNSLVQVTSTTKAATGMKIVKKDASNRIVEVFYVVVYGDVTGTGTVLSIGDGTVDATDSMRVLQYAVDKVEFDN